MARGLSPRVDGWAERLASIPSAFSTRLQTDCGVYFLIRNDVVHYVGQSNNMAYRCGQHAAEKEFDRVIMLPVPSQDLNRVEALFITLLRPAMNGSVKTGKSRERMHTQTQCIEGVPADFALPAEEPRAAVATTRRPPSDLEPKVAGLPATGYVREADLVGEPAVTREQAEANRLAGRGIKRPRAGRAPLVPFSAPTLWRRVRAGEFPKPVKISDRVTAWRVEDVRAWMLDRV